MATCYSSETARQYGTIAGAVEFNTSINRPFQAWLPCLTFISHMNYWMAYREFEIFAYIRV
jgi:hypothetical protein